MQVRHPFEVYLGGNERPLNMDDEAPFLGPVPGNVSKGAVSCDTHPESRELCDMFVSV